MSQSAKARAHALGIRVLYGGDRLPRDRWVQQPMPCGCVVARPEDSEPVTECPAHAALREHGQ